MLRKDLHEANRLSWNEATEAHNSHKKDQAAFFLTGGQTLFPEERKLLGQISGLEVLHLQCNSGQDSLSLAQLGAKVTGVDISDTAVEFARHLSATSAIPATFYRADVYDWLEAAAARPKRCDVAFSSYGALPWLSDLNLWARRVAAVLRLGGRLVLVEFHPFLMVFEDDWTLKYPYFAEGQPLTFEDGIGDYVALSGPGLAPSGYLDGAQDFRNQNPCYEFQWSVGEIVTAILGAGLQLTQLREYPYMNGARLMNGMVEGEGDQYYPPPDLPSMPLMLGLTATKVR
jgi:SAM-dependent methyltransferase